LFRRPPYGLNGKFPVATWYNVTPIDHKSTVAPNVFATGFLKTALSYLKKKLYLQTTQN